MIKNELKDVDFNELILNKIIKNKEDLIIKNNNYILQISSWENQINNIYDNISNIIILGDSDDK